MNLTSSMSFQLGSTRKDVKKSQKLCENPNFAIATPWENRHPSTQKYTDNIRYTTIPARPSSQGYFVYIWLNSVGFLRRQLPRSYTSRSVSELYLVISISLMAFCLCRVEETQILISCSLGSPFDEPYIRNTYLKPPK